MSKTPNKTRNKDSQKVFIAKKKEEMHGVTPNTKFRLSGQEVKEVAKMHGVTSRYVNYILSGERNNTGILNTCMYFLEGKNALVEEVKKLIPFN